MIIIGTTYYERKLKELTEQKDLVNIHIQKVTQAVSIGDNPSKRNRRKRILKELHILLKDTNLELLNLQSKRYGDENVSETESNHLSGKDSAPKHPNTPII